MADKDTEVLFPVGGLNVATEFGRPPKQTTPTGSNVRAYAALQKRGRGGSRAGLSKFLADTVPAGIHLIQHLNVVVDPQQPSLLANATLVGDTMQDPDTRFPDRLVPIGGSAVQLNRNINPPTDGNVFVQKKGELLGNVSTVQTITLTTNPNVGDLIVIYITTTLSGISSAPVSKVTNAGLLDFDQVGGSGYTAEITGDYGAGDFTQSCSMWYRIAASADDQTIKITPGSLAGMEYAVVVYRGLNALNPFTANAKAEVATNESALIVSGLVLNGTSNQLVVEGITPLASGAATASTGFTARFGMGSTASNLYVAERVNDSGVGPRSFTATRTGTATPYSGIAAAFTR